MIERGRGSRACCFFIPAGRIFLIFRIMCIVHVGGSTIPILLFFLHFKIVLALCVHMMRVACSQSLLVDKGC